MALTKTVNTQINANNYLAVSTEYGAATITAVDCSQALIADVEAVCTYHASGTVAAVVRIYASSDNSNFGSSPVDQFTMPFAAGATKRWSKTVIPSMKYMKATIYNADAAYYISTMSVFITLQT